MKIFKIILNLLIIVIKIILVHCTPLFSRAHCLCHNFTLFFPSLFPQSKACQSEWGWHLTLLGLVAEENGGPKQKVIMIHQRDRYIGHIRFK